MQNMIGSIQGGTIYHALGDGRVGLIDIRDIADFAATVLTNPEPHAGKVYPSTGPASISMDEAAATLGLNAVSVPLADAVAAMIGAGFPQWVAEVSGYEYGAAYASGWGDYTTPDFRGVTGKTARSFAEFGRDYAGALGL